jgi:hypothetical protein
MATILNQQTNRLHTGGVVVTTVVALTADSDSVELPRMSAASGPAVAQVVRGGDPVVTVTQTDIDTAGLVGTEGNVILIVSHSRDPIPTPVDF